MTTMAAAMARSVVASKVLAAKWRRLKDRHGGMNGIDVIKAAVLFSKAANRFFIPSSLSRIA